MFIQIISCFLFDYFNSFFLEFFANSQSLLVPIEITEKTFREPWPSRAAVAIGEKLSSS